MTRIHCDCCGILFDETHGVTVSGMRFCSDACCETHVDERCDCSMPDHWRIYDDMQPQLPLGDDEGDRTDADVATLVKRELDIIVAQQRTV